MVRYLQFRLGKNIGWRGRIGLVVSMALALSVAVAVVVLALGVALVLVPIVAIGLLVATWRLRAFRAVLARATEVSDRKWDDEATRTIEADYTVTQGSDRKPR